MGFEPTERVNVLLISSQARSTTPPPLRESLIALGSLGPSGLEELRQNTCAFIRQDATPDTDPMRRPGIVADLEHRSDSPETGIERTNYQRTDSRLDDGSCAHRTWFQRHVQRRFVESPAPHGRGSIPQRLNLCMGQRILIDNPPVPPSADHSASQHHHSSNGDIPTRFRFGSLHERLPHPLLVFAALHWCRLPSLRTKSVHPSGVEPETFGSVVRCSIQLSYGCSLIFDSSKRSKEASGRKSTRQPQRSGRDSNPR